MGAVSPKGFLRRSREPKAGRCGTSSQRQVPSKSVAERQKAEFEAFCQAQGLRRLRRAATAQGT